jgi:hypothetical protein
MSPAVLAVKLSSATILQRDNFVVPVVAPLAQ